MQKIKSFLRSFSFRAGALIFFALSATLLTLRVLIYTQSIDGAYDDIRFIIDAYVEEVGTGMKIYGFPYTKKLVSGVLKDTHDKHLYLAVRKGDSFSGNIDFWPVQKIKPLSFKEIILPRKDGAEPLHLLVKIVQYHNKNIQFFVAYDLHRVDLLQNKLFKGLVENLALAFLLSLFISLLIVWLLNRYFRRFNIACERIMAGEIDYRVRTHNSNDEFDKLASNLNLMLDWNRTLINTVKDSSNAIAHDMRTPLSRLRLELRALSDRPKLDQETRLQVLEHVERVDSLIDMFENILNISRAESRSSTELFEEVDIRQLVKDVVDFYEPIFEEKRLQLRCDIPEGSLMIKSDKQLLGQAVVNLIDNCCKYTKEDGLITVNLQAISSDLILTVADNGLGIPPELLEKAKERFFRVDTSRNTKGYGLGLSLVNAVAALHRGSLVLEDNCPGLKVTLTLHGVL